MDDRKAQSNSIDPFSREVLEFRAVVSLLRGFLSGPISQPFLDAIEPQLNLDLIRHSLELAREAREFLRESTRPSFGGLQDPRPLLAKLRIEGVSLAALEILALVEVAKASLQLRRLFSDTATQHLDGLARRLADFRSLVAALDGKILPDGTLDSSASRELARIRRLIERLRHEVEAGLERLLRRLSADGVLQDAVVTVRNDRFVIPIRAEEKRRVPGVIHGASSSGATVFVEPMETVPLNNELRELQDREFAEIQRILSEFLGKLRDQREDLINATAVLSEIDLAFGKAEFGRQYHCCIPEFNAARALTLREVRHPLLVKSLGKQSRSAIPLNIILEPPKTLMLISGPNAGGKTVALKTIGIAVLMAQAGIPVPASEANLPVFGHVLADIGDLQSIEANLSTFSAHMTHIELMTQVADRNDLVLLDEIGASTEPNEGAALAIAILEFFRQRGPMVFVTTHHSRLKSYAAETPEAVNAAMEFDEATLGPTYHLLIGLPGKSSAFDIAQRLGLEPSIVQKGRSLLHPADAEAAMLLASLHAQQAEYERRLGEIDKQERERRAQKEEAEQEFKRERQAKLRELDSRLEATLRASGKKWEQLLAELRKQAVLPKVVSKGDRKASMLAREAREEWNAEVLESLGEPMGADEHSPQRNFMVGDQVRVANVSTLGTVINVLDGNFVEVEVGQLRMRVKRDDVRFAVQVKRVLESPTSTYRQAAEVPEELNVIGTTAEEAQERVDKFLDEAFLGGRSRLRIIHGHGKGILRKTLHEMFASHPHVEKFYPAPQQEGGSGATIVELKV
jgi:DNA mismatch repair protein MutS2